jgi:thymidylate synthase (FAD)
LVRVNVKKLLIANDNVIGYRSYKIMSKVNLIWSTPEGEELVAYMARVSNPENQGNKETAGKLVKYLVKNKHWSPLDMVDMCVEIETTRDIARQILRHRSFYFQEFSQRYAEVEGFELSDCRMQDAKNRQNSLETDDLALKYLWEEAQNRVLDAAKLMYESALEKGIAKEVARKLLPEGLTKSRMYMKGTLRNWIHYLEVRCDVATQKEHREVALLVKEHLLKCYPTMAYLWE